MCGTKGKKWQSWDDITSTADLLLAWANQLERCEETLQKVYKKLKETLDKIHGILEQTKGGPGIH
jgi:oligoribonuclease NrnB/cAMP/cGMP phosphodiesterase (DHH superfamily)